jgi:hypothetical protein
MGMFEFLACEEACSGRAGRRGSGSVENDGGGKSLSSGARERNE